MVPKNTECQHDLAKHNTGQTYAGVLDKLEDVADNTDGEEGHVGSCMPGRLRGGV